MKPTTLILGALLLAVLACSDAGSPAAGGLPAPGSTAPDASVTRLDGQSLALSALRGRTVLLNFWFHG